MPVGRRARTKVGEVGEAGRLQAYQPAGAPLAGYGRPVVGAVDVGAQRRRLVIAHRVFYRFAGRRHPRMNHALFGSRPNCYKTGPSADNTDTHTHIHVLSIVSLFLPVPLVVSTSAGRPDRFFWVGVQRARFLKQRRATQWH